MSRNSEFFWYIHNYVKSGHRGDTTGENHNTLEALTSHAKALEAHGWRGALIGTGWGRPDTFTVTAALAARTTSVEPLIAIRPDYWLPANFASAAATLDHLTHPYRFDMPAKKTGIGRYGGPSLACGFFAP
jgi:alkanesulfonate monooxygenase